jgi:membrane-associated phospholipid phosphatase
MVWLVVVAAIIAASFALDRFVFHTVTDEVIKARILGEPRPKIDGWKQPSERDWYQQLRQLGSIAVWLVVAAVLFLIETDRRATGGMVRGAIGRSGRAMRSPGLRSLVLTSSVLLGGLMAELLKGLISRRRPEDVRGIPEFWSWSDPAWRWSDCGLPSSHAAVAFAAAWAIAMFHPRAGWILLPLAFGCGLTRIINGNHFFSDVVVGGIVGISCAMLCGKLFGVRTDR